MAEEKKAVTTKVAMAATSPVNQAIDGAPVIYIDGVIGFGYARGIVLLNLYQDRLTVNPERGPNQEGGITRTVCARLVMNKVVAAELIKWLKKSLEGIEAESGSDALAQKAD